MEVAGYRAAFDAGHLQIGATGVQDQFEFPLRHPHCDSRVVLCVSEVRYWGWVSTVGLDGSFAIV